MSDMTTDEGKALRTLTELTEWLSDEIKCQDVYADWLFDQGRFIDRDCILDRKALLSYILERIKRA